MTAGDNSKDDDERQMSEWMKVMLEELERKRDEHDEALVEDKLRRGGAQQKSDAATHKSAKRESPKRK